MTVFARRDVLSTAISATHGGCGQVHHRPEGADLWALECAAGCEDFLRGDPLWSSTISQIPETPDENITREDWEKRGASDQQYVMAMALAKMAGVTIPESLTRVLTGRTLPSGASVTCPSGHAAAPGAKFCPECAAPLAPEVVRCKDGHANAPEARFCSECAAPMGELVAGTVIPETPKAVTAKPARKPALKDLRVADLQAKCREMGLATGGTKRDLLARIRAAK